MYFKVLAAILLVGPLAGCCVIDCARKDAQEVSGSIEQLSAEKTETEEVQWILSLTEGLKSARQANKPLLVYFHAEWCSWCKRMIRDTYSAGEVIGLSRNFVCVKVDTDKDLQVPKEYKVTGLPTIIFLNPEGEVIKRVVGFKSSADLAGLMKEVIEDAGTG